MANITMRKHKDGSTSYLIRVYSTENSTGHQITKSMTWNPEPGMRPSVVEKELNRQATLFEEKVKQGMTAFGGSAKFGDYAREWIRLQPIAPKTRESYLWLMERIDIALGNIRLDKLSATHLEAFYKNLGEKGIKERCGYAESNRLRTILNKKKMSASALAKKAGVSIPTCNTAARGEHISVEKASAICAALEIPVEQVFTLHSGEAKLAANTVLHYHRLISAILASAKRQRLIPFNVAAEQCTAPKAEHKEAKFLTDEQARRFLEALSEEPDIRVKAALILLLFTGLRRGELLGLEWPDIDMEKCEVHVLRASQVQKDIGVTEAPTKNASSVRSIKITAYVVDMLTQYHVWWNERKLQFGSAWKDREERLFVQDDGKPLYPDTINYWLERLLEKHGFFHITPHSLRHTFCTLELAAGVDFRTLQSMSGHAQASTLINIYGHALASAQQKAAEALENTLLPKRPDVSDVPKLAPR